MSAPRNRQPGPSPSQIGSQNRDHDDRLALANPTLPWFVYNAPGATADSILISPRDTGAGDSTLLVPFRALGTSWASRRPAMLSVSEAHIDLSATGLAINGGTGGRVDGIALAADMDYLLWAFAHPAEGPVFAGFGLTTRPQIAATTGVTGGGLGASTIFTVAAGEGFRFNVGARILARAGVAPGSAYNQGIITAVTSTTIVATLDAAYGVANESNAAIVNPVELLQLDKFTPSVPAQATTFGQLIGGVQVPYQYTYMGMLHSGATTELAWVRNIGDFYPLLTRRLIAMITQLNTGSTINIASLARYIPRSIRTVAMQLVLTRTGGPSSSYLDAFAFHPRTAVTVFGRFVAATIPTGVTVNASVQTTGTVDIQPLYSTYLRYLQSFANADGVTSIYLLGYLEPRW